MATNLPNEPGNAMAPDITWRGYRSVDERESRIREAAYYRYLGRGCCNGHDLDDWLAAEDELDHGTASASVAPPPDVQQSSVHGAMSDDRLKQAVRQHPHKAIPLVESVEPSQAPSRE
jgi:hypothetical protein